METVTKYEHVPYVEVPRHVYRLLSGIVQRLRDDDMDGAVWLVELLDRLIDD